MSDYLDTEIISITDFPMSNEAVAAHQNRDRAIKLKDQKMLQILLFFKRNPQNLIYVIEDKDLPSGVNLHDYINPNTDLEVLNSYGIFLRSQPEIGTTKRNYLMIFSADDLTNESVFADAVLRESSLIPDDAFSSIIICKEYFSEEEIEADNEFVQEQLPDKLVLNAGFHKITKSVGVAHAFSGENMVDRYYDLSDLFIEYDFCNDVHSSTENMRTIVALVDKLCGLSLSKRVLFLSDKYQKTCHHEESLFRNAYLSIAAYLTIHKRYLFDIPSDLTSSFKEKLNSFRDPVNCYASDYVKLLQNPLRIGLHRAGSLADMFIGYYDSVDAQNNKTRITIAQWDAVVKDNMVVFNEDDRCELATYGIFDIEPLSIEDIYGITSSDWEIASAALKPLTDLCETIEQSVLHSTGQKVDTPIMCTNLLLFKAGDVVKIGYITDCDVKIKYGIKPVDPKFPPFNYEVHSLTEITNVRVGIDCNVCIRRLMQNAAVKSVFFDTPRLKSDKGILVSSLRVNTQKLGAIDGLTFSDIGIWSAVTRQYRTNEISFLNKYMTFTSARECGLLTYFGGPHQGVSTNILLKTKTWR